MFDQSDATVHEPLELQLRDVSTYQKDLKDEILDGKYCDRVSGGYGDFGSVTNPIPVNGAIGEIKYLSKLRGRTGSALFFHRLGCAASQITKKAVDIYEVVCLDATQWNVLHFDMYHPRRSNQPPPGYSLVPYDKSFGMDIPVGYGVNSLSKNFPYNLPDTIQQFYKDDDGVFARHARECLAKADFSRRATRPNPGEPNNKQLATALRDQIANTGEDAAKLRDETNLQQHRDLIALYLVAAPTSVLRDMGGSGRSPEGRIACQLFILGVVDMIRHANKLDPAHFLELVRDALANNDLMPDGSSEDFVELARRAARGCDVVATIINEGATSMRSYVADRDAEAPLDLVRMKLYAQKHASQLIKAMDAGAASTARKPTEDEVERAVMYASMLARTNENDNSRLSNKEEIDAYLDLAFAELQTQPDNKQKRMAHVGVDALLVEDDCIEELMKFRLSESGSSIPTYFRDKMLSAIEKVVNPFVKDRT